LQLVCNSSEVTTKSSLGAKKHTSIGVFGGTFDPVHEGHILLAEYVLHKELVDRILFLPAARPPHKTSALAPFDHRVAMLRLALAGRSGMSVSTLESRRDGPSYTVDSLRALHNEYPESPLSFIVGSDSLLELHLWHKYTEILSLADLIVISREGIDAGQCATAIENLPGGYRPVRVAGHNIRQRADGARILYLSGFTHSVSSSMIREQLLRGIQPEGLDDNVFSYIRQNHLYT